MSDIPDLRLRQRHRHLFSVHNFVLVPVVPRGHPGGVRVPTVGLRARLTRGRPLYVVRRSEIEPGTDPLSQAELQPPHILPPPVHRYARAVRTARAGVVPVHAGSGAVLVVRALVERRHRQHVVGDRIPVHAHLKTARLLGQAVVPEPRPQVRLGQPVEPLVFVDLAVIVQILVRRVREELPPKLRPEFRPPVELAVEKPDNGTGRDRVRHPHPGADCYVVLHRGRGRFLQEGVGVVHRSRREGRHREPIKPGIEGVQPQPGVHDHPLELHLVLRVESELDRADRLFDLAVVPVVANPPDAGVLLHEPPPPGVEQGEIDPCLEQVPRSDLAGQVCLEVDPVAPRNLECPNLSRQVEEPLLVPDRVLRDRRQSARVLTGGGPGQPNLVERPGAQRVRRKCVEQVVRVGEFPHRGSRRQKEVPPGVLHPSRDPGARPSYGLTAGDLHPSVAVPPGPVVESADIQLHIERQVQAQLPCVLRVGRDALRSARRRVGRPVRARAGEKSRASGQRPGEESLEEVPGHTGVVRPRVDAVIVVCGAEDEVRPGVVVVCVGLVHPVRIVPPEVALELRRLVHILPPVLLPHRFEHVLEPSGIP